ncbi:MAG TPA: plastocyanin/azurin family copper-binding protein, partial [Gemmatimonadales bacterium]|nr:plastocyanin/azurin family copper-binding protein [Gemmatimonadales bacterium]
RIGAGLGLALVIITCTDQSVTGPKYPGRAALDLRAWASAAPGAPVIPIDSLEITFRRADGSVALDQRLGFRPDTLLSDSAVIRLNIELRQNSETFNVLVRAFGSGVDWYRFAGAVQIAAGGVAQPALTGLYVGPGANAVRVVMRPPDTTVIGGTAFGLRALAYGAAGDSIAGVPIGYRLSDSTRGKVTYPTGTTATLTAALALRDSVWVVAETPTHLKDSTRVHILPPAARLLLQSGDKQTSVLNAALPAPLVVRVLDALNGGFKGDTVHWTVTAGLASLKAPVSVSDSAGYAAMAVTPLALGPLTVQAAVPGLQGSPVSFTASAVTGTIKQIVISPKIDTIAYGTTVQYTALAKDTLGNPVTTTFGWTSTVPTIAGVSSSGLATALAGDSTKIIASAGGVADTARLFVRVLRSLSLQPADTVITAVGDSLKLRTGALDNFGAPVTSGLKIKFISASASVVKIDTTGTARLLAPGTGLVLAVDTVGPAIVVQGSATLRVNQVTFGLSTKPKFDTIGVGGQSQLIASALDSNGYVIPGKSFSWVTRPLGVTGGPIASVTSAGLVTGVAIGATYAVDTLVEGLKVFRDSVSVVVSAAPPKLLQWAFDSTAVGNGGSISIGLAVTSPPTTALTVSISSTDSTIAKATPNTVTIPAGASATSATIAGLKAGRAVLTATDASGQGYSSKQMTVGVVSTITFHEIATPCCQQQYFYLNQNETHKAQVWLSDPAPPGNPLGITFAFGRQLAAVTPSTALIPAGQLSADVLFQGLQPGAQPDSVVPMSSGYVGKTSYVYVGPDSLRLSPSNGVVGVGQVLLLYLSIPYAMDHPLIVANRLSSPKGTTPSADTIPASAPSRYVSVAATAAGTDTFTASATGWVPASTVFAFTTPHLGVSGVTLMIAGDPTHGFWTAYPQDSLRYGHAVVDTVRATLVSRDTTIVAVDSPTVKILPAYSAATVSSALRAQPGAGGRSAWLVANAPGYTPDSFQVSVAQPTLTLNLASPYDGRVAVGTLFQNAGYVSIPYIRPDTFWVVFGHTRQRVVAGPDSVAIPKGQTYGYFNTRGDTLSGTDTMRVTRATGYVVPSSVVFHVDSIHVRPYNYPPSTLYTISPPQSASVYVSDAFNSQARPLVAPLRVALNSSDPTAFTLDSAAVTIPAGAYVSTYDMLRVKGANASGAYIRTTAPGSTPDSVGPIKVLATPLALNFGYPYNGYVGRGLKLPGNYVSIPAAAPNTLTVTLQRYAAAKDSLSATSVLIPKGTTASAAFDVLGLDSTGTDSITATATTFLTARQTLHDTAAALLLQAIGATHLTSEPPQNLSVYTRMRAGYNQNVINPVLVGIKSSDSTVIQVDSIRVRRDSGTATVAGNQGSAMFKISYVGSGTARLRVSASGFDADSSPLISVTGPSLHLGYTTITTGLNQIFQSEYVYLDNAVTGSPLVVTLLRSDSSAASPFTLSTTSVTIQVGLSQSPVFEITGQNKGSALLVARGSGYSQATANVQVDQPRLAGSSATLSLFVGAPPTSFTVYTEDQAGATRIVNPAITIADASTAPSVAVADSAAFPIPLRAYYNSVGLRGLQKGSAALVFSSPTYKSDTLQVSVDTATLVLNTPPNGLGTGQTAQMTASIPFTAVAAVTVNLTSSAPSVLGVPATVTIPATSSSASFTVTGGAPGTANVGATATGFYQAALVPVTVGVPKLALSTSASLIVSQKSTITVNAQDASGAPRNVANALVVTLVSSRPSHTSFDSSTITIPAGSYYVQTGVTVDSAAAYTFSASATGYAGANLSTTATGALVKMVAPTSFSPLAVTISAGQYVTWKNTDAIAHTATSDALPSPIWDTGTLQPGATSSPIYFPTAGTYTYHCTIHGVIMSGTVVVQ